MGKLTNGAKFALLVLVLGGAVLYLKLKTDVLNFSKDKGTSTGAKADLVLGINTWSGFAPIVWLNDGLEPNENSQLYRNYGIKLRIKINDMFDDSRNNFKTDNYNLVYCTTDVLPIEMGAGSGMVEAGAKQFIQVDWSRGGDAIVVRKGINTVADLRGKTIAVALGTASHSLLIKVLESNGLTMNDVQVKLVSDGIEAAKIYKSGETDAAVVWSPDDLDCVDAIPGTKVLVNTKTATHIIADGILVKEEFLNDNMDLLVKFGTAWLEANGKINKSDALANEAAQAFATAFNVDKAFAYNGIKNVRLTTLGDNKDFFELNPQYQGITGDQLYTKMSQVYSKLNLSKNALPWRNVSTTAVIDKVNLTADQEAETIGKFSAVTEEVKSKAAISNKKVTINFVTNSSVLSDDAQGTIDKEFVNIAKTFANARIRIEGNTDAVGDGGYNKSLSLKRAQAVANYLVNNYGFDANRFIVIGNGMSKAVADGVSGANELYRRTDFQLVEE